MVLSPINRYRPISMRLDCTRCASATVSHVSLRRSDVLSTADPSFLACNEWTVPGPVVDTKQVTAHHSFFITDPHSGAVIRGFV